MMRQSSNYIIVLCWLKFVFRCSEFGFQTDGQVTDDQEKVRLCRSLITAGVRRKCIRDMLSVGVMDLKMPTYTPRSIIFDLDNC